MSDKLLRKLERRWIETRSVEDEIAFLQENLRLGNLNALRVEAAACIGHRAAQAVLGGTPNNCTPLDFWWIGKNNYSSNGPRWSIVMELCGEEAEFRVGLALCWAHLQFCKEKEPIQFVLETERRFLSNLKSKKPIPARPIDRPSNSLQIPLFISLLWPESCSPSAMVSKQSPAKRFWNIQCSGDLAREKIQSELSPWLLMYHDPILSRFSQNSRN